MEKQRAHGYLTRTLVSVLRVRMRLRRCSLTKIFKILKIMNLSQAQEKELQLHLSHLQLNLIKKYLSIKLLTKFLLVIQKIVINKNGLLIYTQKALTNIGDGFNLHYQNHAVLEEELHLTQCLLMVLYQMVKDVKCRKVLEMQFLLKTL